MPARLRRSVSSRGKLCPNGFFQPPAPFFSPLAPAIPVFPRSRAMSPATATAAPPRTKRRRASRQSAFATPTFSKTTRRTGQAGAKAGSNARAPIARPTTAGAFSAMRIIFRAARLRERFEPSRRLTSPSSRNSQSEYPGPQEILGRGPAGFRINRLRRFSEMTPRSAGKRAVISADRPPV